MNEIDLSYIKEYQALAAKGRIHGLTCGNDSVNHPLLDARLFESNVVLSCKACSYEQNIYPSLLLVCRQFVDAIHEDDSNGGNSLLTE